MGPLKFSWVEDLCITYNCRWSPHYEDNEWCQTTLWDALEGLPNLRTLDLELRLCKVPLPLNSLASIGVLQVIVLKDIDSTPHSAEILDALAWMVARSTHLTSIDLLPVKPYSKPVDPLYSLHQVFNYCSTSASSPTTTENQPLRIHHLGLNACLVRLDRKTLPHLRHLKFLSLRSIIDPYMDPYDNDSFNLNSGDEQKKFGSSLDEFWRTLKREGVWLEEIVHEDVGVGFLDYLEAYPTRSNGGTVLKSLNLTPDPWYRGLLYSNPMARRFFSEQGALHKHANNMEDLRIEPVYEGDWCFDTYNVDAVSACCQLKVLGMSVLSEHLEEDGGSGKGIGIVRATFNFLQGPS